MPEYLSPGVFIEEVPARLKAIEGVSTSTAGFVGPAERGPVPGFSAPFTLSANDITDAGGLWAKPPVDAAPVLVTSFGEFVRAFGNPPVDPARGGYLAHSVRAFFDNGGKRAFVTRVVKSGSGGATRARVRVGQGVVLRLARRIGRTDQTLFLTSLRKVSEGSTLTLKRVDGTDIVASMTVESYDTLAGSVRLTAALSLSEAVEAEAAYLTVGGSSFTATGPLFHARSPGAWGGKLEVFLSNNDRPAVAVPTGATGTDVPVASLSTFYKGAIVELDYGATAAPTARSYHVVTELLSGNRVRLGSALSTATAASAYARVLELDVAVADRATGTLETFKNLSWNPDKDPEVRKRHYASVINSRSRLVYVEPPGVGIPDVSGATELDGSEAAGPDSQPMTSNGFAVSPPTSTAGTDGDAPGDAEYIGTDGGPGARTGIQSLQDVDDIRIIAAPGQHAAAVQNALISQCERMRYRFAVLDGKPIASSSSVVNDLLAHRNAYDTSFAGLYTPWVELTVGEDTMVLPPSGFVAGIYARTDNDRGVHKAPANEVVRGATGLQSYVTTGEQDVLNPRGVNAIRRFEGRGIRVWGARTLSSDPEFRYVNVRRFLIFMEASIERGTQWVVFEPNSPETWSRVTDSVSAFLHTQWRGGALLGRRPEDAFYVRCDESTMTADDVQNGRLICNIGVAIVRPAEFVIFRIEQITGFGKAS